MIDSEAPNAPSESTPDLGRPLCECHGLPMKKFKPGAGKKARWMCRIKFAKKEGRNPHVELQMTRPEDQPFVPAGSNLGQNRRKQEWIQPQQPKKDMPELVDEVEPLYYTYGQYSGHGNIHEDEIIPPRGAPEGCYFDNTAAEHAVNMMCTLVQFEGRWAGHAIELQWWEVRLVRYIFGWKRADGTRLIRTLYLEVPRKCGKTVLAALIAIYMNYWDGEASPKVYFAASDQSQSSESWDKSRMFIQQDRGLNDASLVFVGEEKAIKTTFNNGLLKALTGKAANKAGLNIHCLVFDELYVQATRDVWDVLTTAQGGREQPLTVAITTAGFKRNTVAFEQHEYARQIMQGVIDDPSFLGVVYGLEVDDDWTDPDNWRKAVPSLGYTINEDYYVDECKKARGQPTRQTAFRTFYLNQWVGQEKQAINMPDWDECEHEIDMDELLGKPCFAGLDLSTTVSLTAFALTFPDFPEPGRYTEVVHHFMPDHDLSDKSYQDRFDYAMYAALGYITLIPGPAIQDEWIIEYIKEQMSNYSIVDCSFDRFGMVKIHGQLTDFGLKMIATGQDIKSMSYPCKEFERLISLHKLVIDDPVMRWQADNMAWAKDATGNIKPDRLNSASRIDGMVAMIMSLDGAFRRGERASLSVYDDRGPDSFYEQAEAEYAEYQRKLMDGEIDVDGNALEQV